MDPDNPDDQFNIPGLDLGDVERLRINRQMQNLAEIENRIAELEQRPMTPQNVVDLNRLRRIRDEIHMADQNDNFLGIPVSRSRSTSTSSSSSSSRSYRSSSTSSSEPSRNFLGSNITRNYSNARNLPNFEEVQARRLRIELDRDRLLNAPDEASWEASYSDEDDNELIQEYLEQVDRILNERRRTREEQRIAEIYSRGRYRA